MANLTFQKTQRLQVVGLPFYDLDPSWESEQGKSDSVAKLYQDFVLGRLDPSQIAGSVAYDADDASEVDPFNTFGLTLEESTAIAERGAKAKQEIETSVKAKKAAAAKAAQEAAEAKLRKQIEEEMKSKEERKSDDAR